MFVKKSVCCAVIMLFMMLWAIACGIGPGPLSLPSGAASEPP